MHTDFEESKITLLLSSTRTHIKLEQKNQVKYFAKDRTDGNLQEQKTRKISKKNLIILHKTVNTMFEMNEVIEQHVT